ncbi:MAG: HEAT repeat domain-containing protein [Planctomycetota bacterium]
MTSRVLLCIFVLLVIHCLPAAYAAGRPIDQEKFKQLRAEIEAARARVERQSGPADQHHTLRLAFAEADHPWIKKELLSMAIAIGGPELEPFLLARLNDDDVRFRIAAAKALGEQGSPHAIEPLLKRARADPEGLAGWGSVRWHMTAQRDALFALSEIGLRHPAHREAIAASIAGVPVATDDLEDPKAQALYVLTQDRALLHPFFERLADEDPETRAMGVVAFRLLKLKQAPEEVVVLLDDPERGVRSSVALLLGEIGDPETVPLLIGRALDQAEDRGVRCNAIFSLGRMRTGRAEPVMRALLQDESFKVNAAIALSRITGERHPLVPDGYGLD